MPKRANPTFPTHPTHPTFPLRRRRRARRRAWRRRTERRTDPDPRIRTRGRSAGHVSFPRLPFRRRGTKIWTLPLPATPEKRLDSERSPSQSPSRMTKTTRITTRSPFRVPRSASVRRSPAGPASAPSRPSPVADARARAAAAARAEGGSRRSDSADVHSGALQRRHRGSPRSAAGAPTAASG